MHLNVSALSDPNSLCIPLVSSLVCAPDYLQPIPIRTLVDSGSTHCFLDSAFAHGHSLPTTPTLPVELRLFDGTLNNIISEIVSLPVKFPSSECMTLDFYVTPLDSCCSLVLGHSLWNFDDDCRIAFNTLKQAFTSTPILMHWVPDAQLVVETDASDYALAAILSIMTKDSEIYPITFHSRTFSTLELNYDIHNKELLAIFKAFKIW